MANRARRQRPPRRDRPAPPPPASAVELNGHAVEPVEQPPPRPSWAWSEAVPLAAAPEEAASLATATEEAASSPASAVKAESHGPQVVRSNGVPSWAWKGAAPAPPLAMVFAEPPAVEEPAPPATEPATAAASAAPAPAAAGGRSRAERILLLAIPAVVALGLVILLSRALPEPSGAGAEALWWSVLAAAGLATLVIVDLAARRLRPSALAGAGLPRLGGGLGEMTVVVAAGALLAGAGILRMPASSGTSATVTAVHASQPQGLAPAVAPPLAMAQAPSAPILPAQRTPVTGGGGADLPGLALDSAMVIHPAVVHAANRGVLPLPPPLRASRGGAAADAAALSGTIGAADAAPVTLGPVAPASATTGASRPSASSQSGVTSCSSGGDTACPAEQVHSLGSEATSAFATVQRGPAPECSPAAGSDSAPPMASACTQGIHLEMLLTDLARAVVADGISSSSLTSGCPEATVGRVTVGDLEIGGVHVAGGPGALVPTSTPEPNTAVTLAAGTVVLNEQRPDRGGRGLTVNAVHIVSPASLLSPFSLDMVIGHSHSAATPGSGCAAARMAAVAVPQAPAPSAGPGTPEGLVPDVLQIRRVLRGVISL
jgi:hypothetical protein